MRIIGGDERHARSFGKIDKRLANALLRLETMLLDFEKAYSFSENLLKLERLLRCFVTLLLGQQRRRHSRHAGRKRDESLAVLGEEFFVDAWLVIEAFGIRFRRQPNEVLVAFIILREQYQMKVGLLTGRARGFFLATAARDVSLAADDRLHGAILHRVVKRDGAKDVAVVRHGTRRHAHLFHTLGERFDLNGAVKKTVISMKMEVYELSVLHFIKLIHRLHRLEGQSV